LQAIDDWQHNRQQEMARVTFDACQHGVLEVDLSRSADRGVELRKTLSYLELVREEVKQRTFRSRQAGVLESLYQDMTGWRQGMIFRLLRRFIDAPRLAAQQADEEGRELLRAIGADTELPGEPEYQELLRLLEEEIASVREEFEYAERENEERVAIERDACLAPEGETWKMMLRQEAALDRSIDRKVRILLRLRKELTNLPTAPAGEDDGARMGNIEEALDQCGGDVIRDGMPFETPVIPAKAGIHSDISSRIFPSAEAMESLKMNDRCGNVYENKGSTSGSPARSWNVIENKGTYAQNAGILLKKQGVIRNAELNATSKWPSTPAVCDGGRSLR